MSDATRLMTPTPEEIADAIGPQTSVRRELFIAAVQKAIASAVAQATERAAKIAEDIDIPDNFASTAKGIGRVVAAKMLAARIAAAIRDVTAPPTKGT